MPFSRVESLEKMTGFFGRAVNFNLSVLTANDPLSVGPDVELRGQLRELVNSPTPATLRLSVAVRAVASTGRAVRVELDLPAYREEGLGVRKRRARRAVGTRVPILMKSGRMPLVAGFVPDQFANVRRFRIRNIVDDVTRA